MTAERVQQSTPRPALPSGKTPPPAANQPPVKARRSGPGFFGYLLAGLIGATVTAGGAYFASQQDIPGFSLTDPNTRHRIAELEERTASLESALRAMPQSAPLAAYQPASQGSEGVNELRSRLDSLADSSRGTDATLQALAQRVDAVERQPGGGETKEAVRTEIASQTAPLQQRLALAEHELDVLTRAQSERQADARTASLTLALTNLKRAISDGRPFPAELAAVETLSASKLPVSQLAPYKDEGIATLAGLQNEFTDASAKTIEAFYANKSNGFMGEVLSRAKSAIQVRPSGSKGDSVEAILGRMSAALKSGDLKRALVEGGTLQSPPQEMMDWFGKAQARVAADEALRKTDQELLASLTRAPGRRQ
ncbi:MAG: COG4223 family protein [Rhodomicrobium sp.]